MDPTLSVISEATERSESPHPSFEPVMIPESSPRYLDSGYGMPPAYIPRASIFSSETSYGEPLPPGQSTFKNLGLGISWSQYERSLPSLPRGSVAALSVSARSGQKTAESLVESIARSDASRKSMVKSIESPRHSLVRSESVRHSIEKPESLLDMVDKPESLDKPRSSRNREAVSESKRRSSAKSSSIASGPAVASPAARNSPPLPPLPSQTSKTGSISTVSTHSSSTPSSTSSSPPTSLLPAATLRTFDTMVDEVATSLAVRTMMHAETIPTSDRTKIGVCTPMSRGDDLSFMRTLASKLHDSMVLHSSYLFALVPSRPSSTSRHTILAFCGDPQELVTRASILAGLRFKTRLAELHDTVGTWMGQLEPTLLAGAWDVHEYHEAVLWDIIRKAANPADPAKAPPGSRSIERMLSDARARLDRLSPSEAFSEAMQDGILVDIRPAMQRAEHGTIPGALIIERNDLEWRFDPRCVDGRLPIADRYDLRVIVYCQEGYTSSLAAAALQDIGLLRATDIDGGFARWKDEDLPIHRLADAFTAGHRSVTPTTPRYGATRTMGE